MDTVSGNFDQLATTAKSFARRTAIMGENRLELLGVELEAEREHILGTAMLALAVVGFGLLASLTLTAAIVLWLWAYSPAVVLLVLTGLYGAVGFQLYRRLGKQWQDWQTLPATLDQLRKDRACLEQLLG